MTKNLLKFLLVMLLIPTQSRAFDYNKSPAKIETFKSFFTKPLSKERMQSFFKNPPSDYEEFMRSGGAIEKRNELDELACFGAANYPDKVGEIFSTYCGGHCDSMVPVCRKYDIITLVPQIQPYFELLNKLSGIDDFRGSLKFMMDKNLQISRVKIATSSSFVSAKIDNKLTESYLESWGVQGVWEKEQLKNLRSLQEQSVPHLAKYYKQKFNFSDDKANLAAKNALDLIESMYISGFHDESRDECLWRLPRLDKSHLRNFVMNEDSDQLLGREFCRYTKKPSTDEFYAKLLQIAVVEHEPIEVVKSLLKKINKSSDIKFITEAFHQSAPYYPEALEFIIGKFPKIVNSQNFFGKTALMYAVQYNNIKSAEVLIKNNVDINLATIKFSDFAEGFNISASGRTPLMYAAWQGKREIMELLLRYGANKNLLDSVNESAANYLTRNTTLNSEEKSQILTLIATDSVTRIYDKKRCESITKSHHSYDEANKRVLNLDSVKEFLKLLGKNNYRLAIPYFGTEFKNDKCYWGLYLYESQPSHRVFWKEFLVEVDGYKIFEKDVADNSLKEVK